MPSSKSEEPYYCSQQINIPTDLPDIMKQFTKAAIRTQPKDVLGWATAYFMALYNGQEAPVKERYEMPQATQKTDTGLTLGLLKILNKQLSDKIQVTADLVEENWNDLSLPKEQFDEILRIGDLTGIFEWKKFLAIAASAVSEDIRMAIKTLCNVLTEDPEGGPSRIKLEEFEYLFNYLVKLDGEIPSENVTEVLDYFQTMAVKHDGFVQPSFFTAKDCPGLINKV